MLNITSIVECALGFLDSLKGSRAFRLKSVHQSFDDGYEVHTSEGFTLKINCYEYIYECFYFNRLFSPKQIRMYHVYCICSNDTPAEIKAILESELKIPSFLHPLSSNDKHKKSVISAYIDLVLKRYI